MGGIYNPPTPQSIGAVPITRELVAGANITIDGGASGALDEDLTIAATGGGGALVLISDETLAATLANFTIDLTVIDPYRDIIVEIDGRGTTAAQYVDVHARFNNDASAIYDGQYIQGTTNLAQAAATLNQTSMPLASITANTANAALSGGMQAEFLNYANPTFRKYSRTSNVLCGAQNSAASMFRQLRTGIWHSPAAITEIDLFCSAGDFAIGTRITVYGRI